MNNVRLRAEAVVGLDAFAPDLQCALAGSIPLFAFGYLHYVPVVSASPLRLGSALYFYPHLLPAFIGGGTLKRGQRTEGLRVGDRAGRATFLRLG